ncbi:MAG: gamma-glutamyl-gamma-aminobutyrate hydrolase family protein [Candidatus Neomarinimicrobiota bacterium]
MSRRKPRVAILVTGQTLAPIRARFGDFDQWFRARPNVPATYRVHKLHEGAAVPPREDSDGWLITGSPGSVNDELSWLQEAKAGIAEAVGAGHPLLGVCFGHQLLAVATGGQVEPNPKGWELGASRVELTEAGRAAVLFQGLGGRPNVYESHRETVTRLPADAQVLGGNGMGLQAFQIGPRAFGVQFHPEFTREIAGMYVKLRGGAVGTDLTEPGEDADASHRVLSNFIQLLGR